jgi:hypothetical protein
MSYIWTRNLIRIHIVWEDKGPEGKVEDEAKLFPWRAIELRVDAMLDHPHDKDGEDEEGEAGKPEACD